MRRIIQNYTGRKINKIVSTELVHCKLHNSEGVAIVSIIVTIVGLSALLGTLTANA